jgi:class 3 adenylate cyclase/tetratricopeptide (TPR) repeat protein
MTEQALDRSAALRPYLPRLLTQWLADDPDTQWREVDGTVVFVDISGFTKLSEKLAKSGREGAEELADAIGSCFARLLAVAYGNGGGLIKFGGDALLLLFTGEDHPASACRAAVGMRRALREIGRIETSGGKVGLKMSVGVHSGTFHFFLVGDSHRELMVTGPSATVTASMEGTAEAGEILVSPVTAAALPPRILGAPKGAGILLRSEPPGLSPHRAGPDIAVSAAAAESCIPIATREYLLYGTHEPEHRRVVVAFLHFDGTDAMIERKGSEAFANALDELVRDVQEAVDDQGVCFLGTDVDKDGGKIILTAGAPISTENDEERMLIVGRRIIEADRRIPVRVGINRGHVFAGDIGPSYRRTYTVMGDAVNLAARVMAKAEPGQVLVTTEVIERSKVTFATVALEPFMVKGKARPVQAFELGEIEGVGDELPAVTEEDRPPFVGREREMAVLRESLESARLGAGRVVEVVGEPGIGKSRLLEELQAMASGMGFSTWVTACDVYQSSTPYFAFRRPLRQLVGIGGEETQEHQVETLRAIVRERIPELESRLPLLVLPFGLELPDTAETASLTDERFRKDQVEDVTAQFLSALLPAPALVTIEDAHWMDEASAELLRRLTRNVGRGPWLVVVTRRDVGTGFVGEGLEFVTGMRPEPLDAAAASAMLSEATEDAPLAPHEMAALAERSGGNPLFLKELIAAARAAGSLDDLPDSVEDVITAQIDQLRPRDRTLLRYASVLGSSFPDRLAYAVLASELADIGPQSWRYLSAFVTRDAAGTVRFTHALVRDAAYGGLPFRRRRALHAAVGETLEREAADPEDQAELLSMHFYNSAQSEKAWRYSLVAAERARSIYANAEAAEFYRRAIDAARAMKTIPPPEWGTVHEALGEVEERLGLFAEAKLAFRTARRLAAGDQVAEARLCLREARIQEAAGRYSEAVRWIRRGERILEGVSIEEAARQRAQLTVWQAVMRQSQGRHREAVRWCERAIVLAQEAGDQDALAHSYYILDWAYMDLGQPEKAVYSERALTIYRALDDLPGQAVVYNNLGAWAYYQGKWTEALEFYEQGREARERTGDAVSAAMGTCNVGEILSDQGRLEEAEPLFRAALRVWKAAGFRAGVAEAEMHLGRVASRSGRFDEALGLFEEARAEYMDVGAGALVLETDARIAECHLFQGRSKQVLDLVDEAFERAKALGSVGAPFSVLHRVAGYAHMQLRELATARSDIEEALEVARARQADFEVALTLRALAELVRLEGRGDPEVAGFEAESQEILDRLGVVSLPRVPLEEGDAVANV